MDLEVVLNKFKYSKNRDIISRYSNGTIDAMKEAGMNLSPRNEKLIRRILYILPVLETYLNHGTSTVGAAGAYQIMPGVAKNLINIALKNKKLVKLINSKTGIDLKDKSIIKRYKQNMAISTVLATILLRDLVYFTNDEYLIVAMYNGGFGGRFTKDLK